MAIWHFQIALVPAGAPAPVETNEGLDSSISWRTLPMLDWDSVTSGCLQKNTPWSSGVETWGDPELVQLYVMRGHGRTEDAFLRIDVRQEIGSTLDTLLTKLRKAGLMLAFSSSEICEPLRREVDEHLGESLAFNRFNVEEGGAS